MNEGNKRMMTTRSTATAGRVIGGLSAMDGSRVRLLAGDHEDEVEASRARMRAVLAYLTTRDQRSTTDDTEKGS